MPQLGLSVDGHAPASAPRQESSADLLGDDLLGDSSQPTPSSTPGPIAATAATGMPNLLGDSPMLAPKAAPAPHASGSGDLLDLLDGDAPPVVTNNLSNNNIAATASGNANTTTDMFSQMSLSQPGQAQPTSTPAKESTPDLLDMMSGGGVAAPVQVQQQQPPQQNQPNLTAMNGLMGMNAMPAMPQQQDRFAALGAGIPMAGNNMQPTNPAMMQMQMGMQQLQMNMGMQQMPQQVPAQQPMMNLLGSSPVQAQPATSIPTPQPSGGAGLDLLTQLGTPTDNTAAPKTTTTSAATNNANNMFGGMSIAEKSDTTTSTSATANNSAAPTQSKGFSFVKKKAPAASALDNFAASQIG